MNRSCRAIARSAACTLLACAAGSFALGQAPPPPPPHLAVFADGAEVPGTVADLGDRAKANIAGRRLFDPAKPVRWVRLSEAGARTPSAFVEFDNGDRLPGTVVGHRPEGFTWRTLVGAAQPMNHPESLPATLQVMPVADVLAPDRPLARPARSRAIVSRVDVRRDRVRRIVWKSDAPRPYQPKTLFLADGTVHEFKNVRWSDDGVIALLTDGSTARHAFDEIAELHLAPRPDPWDAWFETLADDDSGVVQMVCRSGARVSIPQQRFQTAYGLASILAQPTWCLDPLFIPFTDIVRLLAFAPAEAPLSFLEPTRVVQKSPFGASWTWKADRNVQGGPLDLAGPPAGWGFGVQARTELALPLAAGVKEFRGRVGLDRVVGAGGCVRASIHANDAGSPALWQSDILVGSGTFAACASLALAGPDGGQKELMLVADDAHRDRPPGADPFDIRDTVDWGDPLVLFDPAIVPQRTAARLAAIVPAWTGWTVASDPPGRVRLVAQIDPVLGGHRSGWAAVSVAEGSPLRLTRTWPALRPQDKFLVIAVTQVGPAKGPLAVRVDGWQWDVVPPARGGGGEVLVPFVLPLEGRAEGPLTVEIVAPVGQPVQWHALGLTGPLDEGWFPLEPVQMESSAGSTFKQRDDGAVLVSLPPPKRDDYTLRLKSPQGPIRALRMDALLDPSLAKPALGPGRHTNGIFRMSGLTVSAGAAGAETPLEIDAAYSYPPRSALQGPIDIIRRMPNAQWAGSQAMPHFAVLHFRGDEVAPEEIVVKAEFQTTDLESLGCFRLYGSADPEARLPVTPVTTLVREPAPAGAPPKPIVVGKPIPETPKP
jgi:hypothetical protein